MTLSDPYLAKYPFFSAAEAVLDAGDMNAALADPQVLARATERVVRGVNQERVAKLSNTSTPGILQTDTTDALLAEVQSYPIARLLVSALGDYRIVNRYARAEAKTARVRVEDEVKQGYADTRTSIIAGKQHVTLNEVLAEFDIFVEPTELGEELSRTHLHTFLDTATADEIRAFASNVFKLQQPTESLDDETLQQLDPTAIYDLLHSKSNIKADSQWYAIPFTAYVKTAVGMNDTQWRLTNRGLRDGNVLVTKRELFDLFEEAVHHRVSKDLPYDLPEQLLNVLQAAEPFAKKERTSVPDFWDEIPTGKSEVISTTGTDDGVKETEYNFVNLVQAAINEDHFSYEIDRVEPGLFPPVIDRLITDVRNGKNLKHEARFTLVAFFVNIGMTEDEIVAMLEVGGSFGEEPTRYQVGHIKSNGSDGDSYTPANYATMDSWGIEWERDALEAQVTNPLSYYKIKLKQQDEDTEDASEDEPAEA
jgi:DNA primase large subunit